MFCSGCEQDVQLAPDTVALRSFSHEHAPEPTMTRPPADGRSLDDETKEYVTTCQDGLPAELPDVDLAFGFDGFLDRVREMVDERQGPDSYTELRTLSEFGERIRESASVDASLMNEWRQLGSRCGGHTAHLTRAFARLNIDSTMIGTYGDPPESAFLEEFDGRRMHSLGEPTITDAVEFSDGKLLLSESGAQRRLDWDRVRTDVGIETLAEAVDGTAVLGMGYWATIPGMPSIWDGLRSELWPTLSDPPDAAFVDPADVRRLSGERLRDGLGSLAALDDVVPVTVSGNRPETEVLATLCDGEEFTSLEAASETARETLGVSRYVAHSPVASASSTDDGRHRATVPRTADPELTTSAGDHFNAGLLLAHLLGLEEGSRLVLGNALAGHFVRTTEPPTYDELTAFVDGYGERFE